MLTRDLVRAKVVRKTVVPQLVDPERPQVREAAEAVLALVHDAVAERGTRGQVDEALADLCSERPDHRIVRGLAKTCLDRTTFEAAPPVDPVALRREVFLAARARGPLALQAGPLERPTADDVLAEVGARHGLDIATVRRGLYADLKQHQIAEACSLDDPEALVHRYNLALVQAVLLHASRLRVRLIRPEAGRLRQLLRWIRFHQLIASGERRGDDVFIELDGPTSLFRQSTRYGRNLALFLPALALQERWELTADLLWTQRKVAKTLSLSHDDGLVSHYRDTGAYKTKEQTYFEERFAAYDTEWALQEGQTLLPLGSRRFVFPDYTLVRGERRVHLQMVGFWRKETLEAHLADVAEHAPRDLLVAVSKRLAGDKGAALPDQVLAFAEILSPRAVVAAADALAP